MSVVVTKPDTVSGRGRKRQPPLVKDIATKYDIPIIQPESKDNIRFLLKPYDLSIGVVVAFGMILPKEAIGYFEYGLINAHASLLPRWRGPSPIEAALLHGDDKTGVTLMQIAPEMDSGDIYTQEEISLSGDETRLSLYDELSKMSASMLNNNLPKIIEGSMQAQPQDDSQATYTKLIKKSDGYIDWSQPAEYIERSIRAYLGWPGSRATIEERNATITAAHITPLTGPAGTPVVTEDKQLAIYCGKDALIIDSLTPAGKREMSGSDFARGYLG